jgi:hypothetical protein
MSLRHLRASTSWRRPRLICRCSAFDARCAMSLRRVSAMRADFSRRRLAFSRCRCDAGGAHLGKEIGAGWGVAVDPSRRRREDDGAVGKLFVVPPIGSAVKSLEPMVLSAKALDAARHGQAAGAGPGMVEGLGVVDVGGPRRTIAPREATRQIAAADPALERRAGLVAQRFGIIDLGFGQQPKRGRFGELAHLFGVDHAVTLEVTGLLTAALHGLLSGDDVDAEAWGRGRFVGHSHGAVGAIAVTGQGASLAEREQRIGTPLGGGPRVVRTHRGGQLGEPFVDDGCGRGGQTAAQLRHAIWQRGDADFARSVGGDASLLGGLGSMTRTAASTALMMRRRDQQCHETIRSAIDRSSCSISSPLTSSVRVMMSCTVRQSIRPSASSLATLGSRVSNASAWPTS